MRPLNTRERRIQFLRFLALFLLAVLPVVMLTWLYGWVDHAENDFLRSNYARNRVQNEASAVYTSKLQALGTKANDLRKYVTEKSASMEKMKCEEIGEMDDKMGELLGARDDFKMQYKESDDKDSTLYYMTDHYHAVTSKLMKVYEKACAERSALMETNEELKADLTEIEKKLSDCEDKLLQYKTLH